jgi:transposase InsO family protein
VAVRKKSMRISEEVKQRVIELDRRYRSTWDVRSIAHVIGIGHNSVARILREARGPRPKKKEQPHNGRTRITRRDVMWSSDYTDLPEGSKLLKTLDEKSLNKLAWDTVASENAEELVSHARKLVEALGRAPLVWKYDNGSAFKSGAFQAFLAEHKIIPFPIPPRAPWVNGRTERDNQEIQNWLLPLQGRTVSREELARELNEGMLMLNCIKPRAVLGFKRSAEVYLNCLGVADMDRDHLALYLYCVKQGMAPDCEKVSWAIHRRAVRAVLKKWTLLEEWEAEPEDARICQQN